MRILTAVGVGAVVVLCVLRRHDLATATGAVAPQVLGAVAALHLASLVVSGGAGAGALAAGLALSPTSLAAVALYGAAPWLVSRGRGSGEAPQPYAPIGPSRGSSP